MVRRVRRAIRGISPVLATLILIVIAIVAGLVVWAWVSGWVGRQIGAGGKRLDVIHIIFKKGSWTKYDGGWTTADTGTVEYDLWAVGYGYYKMDEGTVKVYVTDQNGNEYELYDAYRSGYGWQLWYKDGGTEHDVGDIDYDDGKITVDYSALESAIGGDPFTGTDPDESVKISCTWYRIDLFVKNTGSEALSIRRVWVGTTSDCPWDWSGRIKHISLPYRLDPGGEVWLYLTTKYDSGKTYFFKIECTDGSTFGPFSEQAP